MVGDFLCTFDNSCKTNIEFSQWSNEILYNHFDKNPGLVFKIIGQGQIDSTRIILFELENPIRDFDYQRIYGKISDVRTKSEFKEKVLKSIELATDKEGLKIKK